MITRRAIDRAQLYFYAIYCNPSPTGAQLSNFEGGWAQVKCVAALFRNISYLHALNVFCKIFNAKGQRRVPGWEVPGGDDQDEDELHGAAPVRI